MIRTTPSSELAYIIGVLEGDGSISPINQIKLEARSKQFVESFRGALSVIGLLPRELRYRKSKSTWIVAKKSKYLAGWYRCLVLADKDELVRGYERDFLRGLYESDGTNYGEIGIRSTNKGVIELARRCLSKLGFSFSFRIGRTPKGKPYYRIYLLGGRKERGRFIEETNPCIRREVKQKSLWGSLKRRMLSDEEEIKRRELHKQGLSDNEIARRVGVDPSCITRWRRTRSIKSNYVSGNPRFRWGVI